MTDMLQKRRTYGPIPDIEILTLCQQDTPLITPFDGSKLQAYGYDVTLSGDVARLTEEAGILDPYQAIPDGWWQSYGFEDGETFVVKPGELWLALTVESFDLPGDIVSLMLNKSRFARCGFTPNAGLAPGDAGWRGRYVLELVATARPVRLTVGTAIAQVQFYRGAPCVKPYGEGHRYQDQQEIRHGGSNGDA